MSQSRYKGLMDEKPRGEDIKLFLKAIHRNIEGINLRFESMDERLERIESNIQRGRPKHFNPHHEKLRRTGDVDNEKYYKDEECWECRVFGYNTTHFCKNLQFALKVVDSPKKPSPVNTFVEEISKTDGNQPHVQNFISDASEVEDEKQEKKESEKVKSEKEKKIENTTKSEEVIESEEKIKIEIAKKEELGKIEKDNTLIIFDTSLPKEDNYTFQALFHPIFKIRGRIFFQERENDRNPNIMLKEKIRYLTSLNLRSIFPYDPGGKSQNDVKYELKIIYVVLGNFII